MAAPRRKLPSSRCSTAASQMCIRDSSYTELMQTAGLKVPFEDGSIKAIAQQMGQWIAEHQV